MVALTPELAGNSLIVLVFTYVVLIAFSIYQLYLNIRQAKVASQMKELIEIMKDIKLLLEEKNGK